VDSDCLSWSGVRFLAKRNGSEPRDMQALAAAFAPRQRLSSAKPRWVASSWKGSEKGKAQSGRPSTKRLLRLGSFKPDAFATEDLKYMAENSPVVLLHDKVTGFLFQCLKVFKILL
jgi:hypothetical protein